MARLHRASSAIVGGRVISISLVLSAAEGGVVPGIGFVSGVGGNGCLVENQSGNWYVDPAKSLYGCSQGFHRRLSAAHRQHCKAGRRGQLKCFRAAQQGRGIEND